MGVHTCDPQHWVSSSIALYLLGQNVFLNLEPAWLVQLAILSPRFLGFVL